MNPTEAAKKLMPLMVFIVFATFTLSLIFNGLKNLDLEISVSGALGIALVIGGLFSFIAYLLVRRVKIPEEEIRTPSRHLPQSVISLDKAMKHLQRVRVASYDVTHTKVTKILDEVKDLSTTLRKETSFLSALLITV